MEDKIVFEDTSLIKLLRAAAQQRNTKADDVVQRAVRLSFEDNGQVLVYYTDRLVYSVARVQSNSTEKREIIVDLETMMKVMSFNRDRAVFFFDHGNLHGLLDEGAIFIPQYRVSPGLFEANTVAEEKLEERRLVKADLLRAIKTVKKVISSAELPEMRMMYGTSEGIYGCNGTTVIKNKTPFINGVIRLKDLGIVQEILGEGEDPVGARLFSNRIDILSPYQKISLPRRDITLSNQYIRSVEHLENYFELDPARLYRVLNLLSTLPQDAGHMLLSIKIIEGKKTLIGITTTNRGEMSKITISDNLIGDLEPSSFRIRTRTLADVIYGFLHEPRTRIAIYHDMLKFENEMTQAAVVTSLVQ